MLDLGHHFETKATATNRTSWNWGTTSRPKQRQQIVHLCIGAPLRDQSNGNKSYILELGHHFESEATATNRTSYNWGTTSRPKQRQQIVHLSIGAPLRDQSNGNKSHILALGHHPETKATATNRTLSIGAPLRDQSHGNKSHILEWGHHFETKATATNRTSFHWGTTSRPKQRQQIVHLSIGAPLRDQSNGNKSYVFALGHHFETKATATNRTSFHWGKILRGQSNGNKSYILALRHHVEPAKATATNRTS